MNADDDQTFELQSLDVKEISFVPRGANKKNYLILKCDGCTTSSNVASALEKQRSYAYTENEEGLIDSIRGAWALIKPHEAEFMDVLGDTYISDFKDHTKKIFDDLDVGDAFQYGQPAPEAELGQEEKEADADTIGRKKTTKSQPKEAIKKNRLNKAHFSHYTKTEGNQMDSEIQAILEAPWEGEERYDAILKAKELSPQAVNAVKGAMKILNAYKDEDEVAEMLEELEEALPGEKARKARRDSEEDEDEAEEGYGYPAPGRGRGRKNARKARDGKDEKDEDEEEAEKCEPGKDEDEEEDDKKKSKKSRKSRKMGKPLYADTEGSMASGMPEGMKKGREDDDEDDDEEEDDKKKARKGRKGKGPDEEDEKDDMKKVYKEYAVIKEENEQIRKELDELKREKVEKEYIEKAAKEYEHVPVKKEDLGRILMKMDSSMPKEAKKIEATFKQMNEILEKNQLFKDFGSAIPGEDSPIGRVESLADQLIQKSAEPLTADQAREKVILAHPELYEEYMRDNPQLR